MAISSENWLGFSIILLSSKDGSVFKIYNIQASHIQGYAKGLGGVDVTSAGPSVAEGRRKQEGCLRQMAQAIVTRSSGQGTCDKSV